MNYTVKELNSETWNAYSELIERHNGVWGGCWCTWFHDKSEKKDNPNISNKDLKKELVINDKAHAAIVFDGYKAIGWCQFGAPTELPNIYHKKEYEKELIEQPEFRLTCFFVDKDYRKKGVATIALNGAISIIAKKGGGLVEGYPQDTKGKTVSSSFLYNGTREMFEKAGFSFNRPKGKNHCVMIKRVEAIVK